MTGAVRTRLDPHVVLIPADDGLYVYHEILSSLHRLSPAGRAFLKSLGDPDAPAAFGRRLGLPPAEAPAQHERISRQLRSLGICREESADRPW